MALEVDGLALERDDGAPLLAPLTLVLAPGDRLGLVGESGSGKSLLVQAIFGVLPRGVRQVGGKVTAFGVPLDRPHPDRDRVRGHRLAWVPQDPLQALNPFLRVQDQLTLLPAIHLGETRQASLARLGPLLERLRLPRDRSFLRRFPHQISGGQRQRLVLANATVPFPRTYIHCTKKEGADVFAQFAEKYRAAPGWDFVAMRESHSPNITAPPALAEVLLRAAA